MGKKIKCHLLQLWLAFCQSFDTFVIHRVEIDTISEVLVILEKCFCSSEWNCLIDLLCCLLICLLSMLIYSKTCVRQPPLKLTLVVDEERWLSYKGTCHVILLAKLHDMYLYKTDNFFHTYHYLKSVSKVALFHRFYCIKKHKMLLNHLLNDCLIELLVIIACHADCLFTMHLYVSRCRKLVEIQF